MSYEGFSQYICAKGHYQSKDCNDSCETCYCGEPIVWENMVDETNGESFGLILMSDIEKFKIKDAKICVCSCCGHEHCIEPPLFQSPTEKETGEIRTINFGNRNMSYIKDLKY